MLLCAAAGIVLRGDRPSQSSLQVQRGTRRSQIGVTGSLAMPFSFVIVSDIWAIAHCEIAKTAIDTPELSDCRPPALLSRAPKTHH